MSHAIHVPDERYDRLLAYAKQQRQSPEDMVLAWVTEVVQHEDQLAAREHGEDGPTYDPIAPFIGAFAFGVQDLAEEHDQYLADAAADDQIKSNNLFVDTSGWFSLIGSDERYHGAVGGAYQHAMQEKRHVVTTDYAMCARQSLCRKP